MDDRCDLVASKLKMSTGKQYALQEAWDPLLENSTKVLSHRHDYEEATTPYKKISERHEKVSYDDTLHSYSNVW